MRVRAAELIAVGHAEPTGGSLTAPAAPGQGARSVTLVIPGDPLPLSPNARLHPAARRQLVRDWKAKTWDAWEKAGRPRLTPPVVIRFVVCRARSLDPDNAAAAMKCLVDALTDRGSLYEKEGQMLPDDSADMVSYQPIMFVTGKNWKDHEQVILHGAESGAPELPSWRVQVLQAFGAELRREKLMEILEEAWHGPRS